MGSNQDPIDQLINSCDDVPPETLWHYTSTSAFINMVEKGSLWFTDYNVLNDSKEYHYGVDVFQRQLNLLLHDEQNTKKIHLLERIQQELEDLRKSLSAYVFCMTTNADSPTHWQIFAARGEPLAVGFNSASLHENVWQKYKSHLFPIIYIFAIQESLANRAIQLFLEYPECASYISGITTNIESIRFQLFAIRCGDLCVRFKSPEFSDEKEWRLLTHFRYERGPTGDVIYRSSGTGIRPVLNMVAENKRLPIKQLVMGPFFDRELQAKLHSEFLISLYNLGANYLDVKVTSSKSSLR